MMENARSLKVELDEGISFSLTLAGPITRFLAWMLDFFVIAAISMITGAGIRLVGLLNVDFALALNVWAFFILSTGYPIFCELCFEGQTLGKRLFRLRVIDAGGLPLQPHQVVIRNILRLVDMLPIFYFVGGVAMMWTRYSQRLGDIAANTIVIRQPQILQPDLDQIAFGKFNSLRQYPHLEARLRQRVTVEEASLALQALLRRNSINVEHRVRLFQTFADHFKTLVIFPPECSEGITDEQYVRNVIEVVYRSRTADKSKRPPTRTPSDGVPQP